MNIRDIKTHAAYLLLLGVLYAPTSCQRKNDPVPKPVQQRPIELSAATEWPDSKGIINNVTDLAGDGFVVWASWSQDLGNGITKNDMNVFGVQGTKAYYPDWSYKPTQFWVGARYEFAAVLPASVFNASHGLTGESDTGQQITGTFDGKDLELDFGDGFDLSASQTDIMYTFTAVDNSDENASNAQLDFTDRICSQLRINMTADISDEKSFEVNRVTIYGINRSIVGDLTISNDEDLNVADIRSLLSDRTTSDNPYATFTKPDGADWTIKNGQETALVTGLLVFPEVFSTPQPMLIKVKYNNNDEVEYRLTAGKWAPNSIYTYTLKTGSIVIGEPKVSEWKKGLAIPEIDIK